jgi:hypothetical protein
VYGPVSALSGQRTITRSLAANVGQTMLARTGFDILMIDYDYDDVIVDMVESSRLIGGIVPLV